MCYSRHFHPARVIISVTRRWHLRVPSSSVRKARCLYIRIVPRGNNDRKERTGSGAGAETGTESGMGTGA